MSEATQYAVLFLALIVLVQTLTLAFLMLRIRSKLDKAEPRLVRALGKTSDWMTRAEQATVKLEELQGKLPGWAGDLTRWSRTATESLANLDGSAERLVGKLRETAHDADRKTDRLLLQYSEKAAQVQDSISRPAHHLSAAIVAIQTAVLRYFSNREENTPYDLHSDQEGFV